MYRILIVEDEELVRKRIRYVMDFEQMGCVVIGEASNGKEGMEKIRDLHPDIVITDIHMPIKTGIEMLRETSKFGYSTIVVSRYDEFDYAREVMKYGGCGYLLKPVDAKELKEALERARRLRDLHRCYEKRQEQRNALVHTHLVYEYLKTEDQVVQKMIAYIREHYGHKVLMADVAQELNYSEALLNRRFKAYTSYTFNDYLNQYRIQKAIEMIKGKRHDLQEIAALCGFRNYKYFSVVFRKYVECSPNEFMQAVKAN